MEFATTQSFVKSLEGVRNSGILEDPVLSDVSHMIELSYNNGTIDEALEYMSNLYPYYIVKNILSRTCFCLKGYFALFRSIRIIF